MSRPQRAARLDEERFFRIAKAIADPTRLAILERIATEPEVVCAALIDEFPISQATMSHHVRELREAGLIETEKVGKCLHIKALHAALESYRAELARRIPSP